MGRPAIEQKLHNQLTSADPLSEARVVYILVEIRKLLELQGELDRYPALRFHCDWAVHPKMDRAGAQRILRLFNEAHPLLCGNQQLPQTLEREISELTNLRGFRRDLEQFSTDYNLPRDILQARWTEFLHSYAAVTEDCPLIVRADDLTNIRSVTLNKEEANANATAALAGRLLYRIRWTCEGVDGKVGVHESYNTIP